MALLGCRACDEPAPPRRAPVEPHSPPRLVELYTSSDQDSTLAVLLGSSSLDQMLTRIDAVDRVDQQDALVLSQVTHLRREVQQRQRRLKHDNAAQTQIVAQRAAARASMQSQRAQRRA